MRVLHLYAGNLYGGVEAFMATLARSRGLAGMEPTFGLCFEGRLAGELRSSGAMVEMLGEVRFSRPWQVLAARENLRRLLSRERFDVATCHSAWPHALFAGTVRSARLPLVYWAHGPATGHWLERMANRTPPDRVVTNSEFTLTTQGKLFATCPKSVLRIPVEPVMIVDRHRVRQDVRRQLETPDLDVVIVCHSRLEEAKGHRLLLSALAKLTGVPGWTLWIAGAPQRANEDNYLDELKAYVAQNGFSDRVRFLGECADTRRLLCGADTHCQPNLAPESFGIAFIEALYAGIPVVTTAIGGALEIVTPECGRLVQPQSDDVAVALRELINDSALRMKLGTAGPQRAAALCDPMRAMKAMEQTLLDLPRR